MFRIRQIADTSLPSDQRDVARVQQILRERFSGLSAEEIDALPDRLRDPLRHRLRAMLLVADDLRGHLKSFALLSHAPDVGFALLDFIASGKDSGGGGGGGALYERVRETALGLGATGLYFECLPDEPEACSDPAYAAENASRLRFYERFGARPIVGTAYETPLNEGDLDMPHLVYDDLGRGEIPSAAELREVVRAILERKYGELCSPEYVALVVDSIQDPIQVRPARYVKRANPLPHIRTGENLVALVVNRKHDIHHIRERGYVEAPARVRAILDGLLPTGLFWEQEPKAFPVSHIDAVHDPALTRFLKAACAATPEGKSTYPYVFPLRNRARLPKDLTYAAGYYCLDSFTPLNRNAFPAARRAVDCALTAAGFLLESHSLSYALVRPPGHHAERSLFGGFCYFNNAAIAAHYLSEWGKVAILDVDYHHGNGQQDIFYSRDDVLTVSIHGHPSFAYPFFSGFDEEIGEGPGEGYNLNLPLPETVDGAKHLRAVGRALERISQHEPRFLIVCLGYDTARQDPTGTWTLGPKDFEHMGQTIGALRLPTLVVQEGGYRTRSLGSLARSFFEGLVDAHGGVY
ncbi:histone deacetylase family protein [Engelhardtia mirabilis]|uniref:Acetylpolyamine aminohydrolase n=1 Tax=Engelhardtia mirabilis TaxID=2528011 RepID=A0A518BF80_9BACT|nr:Acetylpolyamine aminohydrolase [Planctomycetes bacterium Pla133]QDU99964.1 Acetylpolyamine aminohydrolase [Planctomycetes bacterium Pla86]